MAYVRVILAVTRSMDAEPGSGYAAVQSFSGSHYSCMNKAKPKENAQKKSARVPYYFMRARTAGAAGRKDCGTASG